MLRFIAEYMNSPLHQNDQMIRGGPASCVFPTSQWLTWASLQVHGRRDARHVQHQPSLQEEGVCDDCHSVGPGLCRLLPPAVRLQHHRWGRLTPRSEVVLLSAAAVARGCSVLVEFPVWFPPWGRTFGGKCFLGEEVNVPLEYLVFLASRSAKLKLCCTLIF